MNGEGASMRRYVRLKNIKKIGSLPIRLVDYISHRLPISLEWKVRAFVFVGLLFGLFERVG